MSAPLLKVGTSGPEVKDLEQKLAKAGYLPVSNGTSGVFTLQVEKAVENFQSARGLHIDGICGAQTWVALEEAQWQLEDRAICLTSPMMRGDDVGELQKTLGRLGFNAGREDSIFGPETEQALYEFQVNNKLVADKICDAKTFQTLKQIAQRARGENVASVKDRERYRSADLTSLKKIFIAQLLPSSEFNSNKKAAAAIKKSSERLSKNIEAQLSEFETCCSPDSNPSVLAKQAKEFGADVCLALQLSLHSEFHADYFGTESYESAGGKYLANLLTVSIPPILFDTDYEEVEPRGQRSQILQETNMWTVLCILGTPKLVKSKDKLLAKTFAEVLRLWLKDA